MPAVATLEAFEQAIRDADASALDVEIEPEAAAVARRSLDESGLLLLGEVHGVAENPRLARTLLEAFGLGTLGLEWHPELARVVDATVAGGPLREHPLLWSGDGRLTAGHVAVLRAVRPRVVPFDGTVEADWTWSQRDAGMAQLLLAGLPDRSPCLVVAGNLHTRTGPVPPGTPMGQVLARARPGLVEIRIAYGAGAFYNGGPRTFDGPPERTAAGTAQLRVRPDHLELALPRATEAVVPERPFDAGRGVRISP